MNSSSLEARILWNSLPMHEVRAISGNSVSPPLWIRWRVPLHQKSRGIVVGY